MTIKKQTIALYTIVRRELVRMFRIASQVFLPPVITTALYFLIFGSLIGKRIGNIDGVSYIEFIAPGLIMMTVITNAYANVSSSLFSVRFQKNIEEMLISPMHNSLLLLGYILGGIIRSLIVAILVYTVACFFVKIPIQHLAITLLVILIVSATFSLAGFANAMLARNFDDVMIVPTFILAPLTYLGGVFYSTSMLPPFWQALSKLNPILYMVDALRNAMLGQHALHLTSMFVISLILILLIACDMILLNKGIGLRE